MFLAMSLQTSRELPYKSFKVAVCYERSSLPKVNYKVPSYSHYTWQMPVQSIFTYITHRLNVKSFPSHVPTICKPAIPYTNAILKLSGATNRFHFLSLVTLLLQVKLYSHLLFRHIRSIYKEYWPTYATVQALTPTATDTILRLQLPHKEETTPMCCIQRADDFAKCVQPLTTAYR